jgi:Flp pilus assembly protein TadD
MAGATASHLELPKRLPKFLEGRKSWLTLREDEIKRGWFQKIRWSKKLRILFPQSDQSGTRSGATSSFGSYVATFVVGVLGFVAGNLALDAIKEQIYHSTAPSSSQAQSSSQPVLTVPAQSDLQESASQSDPQASAAAQSVPIDPAPLAAHAGPRPVAEQWQPQEASGQRSRQVHPAIPVASLAAARESVGQRNSFGSAEGDPRAGTREIKHDETTAIRLNSELAEWYFERGVAYGQRGSYDKAISEFNEAIRLNPTLAGAYYSRGVTYWYKGNHDRAAAEFNEAIRLDPKLAVAYYGRGCVYMSYGYKAEAEADFAQAKMLGYTSPKPTSPNIIQMSLSILRGAVP